MSDPVTFFRSAVSKGLKSGLGVDRKNKIINGYAVNTLGEALGHDLWLDSDFLDSVVEAGNKMPNGMKSRFTHPGLCADGLGKYLGRTKNLRRDGNVVRGDLHLSDTAENSPDGDLSSYVMGLAEEDPEAFGSSIVFSRNKGAEKEFSGKFSGADGKFASPDKGNTKHLAHARLSAIHACDVVDEPAANPGGFFSRGQELASVGETALEYLFGKRQSVPAETFGGLEPERVKAFFDSFFQRHGLSLNTVRSIETGTTKGKTGMSDIDRHKALRAAFPKHPEFAAQQFEAGATVEEAKTAFKDVQLSELRAENSKLKNGGGVAPTAFEGDGSASLDEGGDFMDVAKAYAKKNNCGFAAAAEKIALDNPELHAAYVQKSRSSPPRKIERQKVMG